MQQKAGGDVPAKVQEKRREKLLKKMIRRLAAGAIVGAMLCTSAGAVQAGTKVSTKYEPTTSNGETYYTVSVTGGSGFTITAGNEYVLMVAKGTLNDNDYVIDPSTLVYIDQQRAEGNTLTFTVKPSWTPDSVVLLGGNFGTGVSSPIVIGYIEGKGTLVSVTIPVLDVGDKNASDITFSWASSGGTPISSATANADGTLNAQIDGTGLTITISRPGYLPLVIKNYSPGADITQYISQFEKGAGDVDGDTVINMVDISKLIDAYDKTQSYIVNADFNRDGVINMLDLSTLISSYDRNTGNNMTFSVT